MKTYPLFKVHIDTKEALLNIENVFNSGFINEGTEVTKLTAALSDQLGSDNLSLTNSCTSALTLSLRLAGINPGEENTVVTTPMTCVATNAAIANLGAKILWCDVDSEHGMMDPEALKNLLHRKSGIKAVMAVAWAGTSPDLRALGEVCREHGARLILDAAHAFSAEYRGAPVHRWADFTCYSFQAIKHFTTGDGGALVCDSWRDHSRGKALKWFGLDRDKAKDAQGNWRGQQWDVDITDVGYKFNMNNVAAAIGLSQLPHIDRIIATHRENAGIYDELFLGDQIIKPTKRPIGSEKGSSFWVYTVKLNNAYSRLTRDDLLKALNSEGIMAGVVHVPNNDYTCFEGSRKFDLTGLREFADNQFSLPCGWWLNKDDIAHIVRRVKELVK